MRQSSDVLARIGEQLLRWRWALMVLLGLVNVAVETVERRPNTFANPEAFYLIEILLFGLLGPLFGGLVLTLAARARRTQQRADHYLGQHKELLALLADARDWDELISLVVRFPRRVVDMRGACLLVYDQASGDYHLETQWWDPNLQVPAGLESLCVPGTCSTCLPEQEAHLGQTFPARCRHGEESAALGARYCLPLVYGSQPMALMYLYLPPRTALAKDQVGALGAMAASTAVALHDAQPQRSARLQAEAADAERRRIARDLHDTLGQNLSYLRLKLDQLSGDNALHKIRVIRQELEQMRAVASEAYFQVRSTLSELQPSPAADLEAAVQQQAREAAERAGFALQVVREGVPRSLPPQSQRQVLYLLGEALRNVERHAGSCHVEMRLAWTDDGLTIRIADDGRGFDPDSVQAGRHFGLGIMRQRALSVDGDLTIASSPGSGTQVTLSVPIAPNLQVQAGYS